MNSRSNWAWIARTVDVDQAFDIFDRASLATLGVHCRLRWSTPSITFESVRMVQISSSCGVLGAMRETIS